MTSRPLRTGSFSALALAAALTAAGCARHEAGAGSARRPGDAAVATVDGQAILASDVRRAAIAQGLIGRDDALPASSEPFRQMLDEAVDEKLLAGEAVRRKLDKDPEVQRRLEAAHDRILADALVQGVVDKAVTDQAVQILYQQQLKQAETTDEIHARQIVTRTLAEAQAVRRQLASGAAFETLAAQRSIDAATRFSGGDLGYFAPDAMPEAYGAALKLAKPGDIVGPFQAPAGYAVLKVEDRRRQQPITLQQARPQIVRFLTYDQVQGLVKQLRSRAKVKLLIPAQPAAVPSRTSQSNTASSRAPSTPEVRP